MAAKQKVSINSLKHGVRRSIIANKLVRSNMLHQMGSKNHRRDTVKPV